MCKEIRIYVACLAAYNGGRLHGVWIYATEELDSIWGQINAMLKASPEEDAEEWAILIVAEHCPDFPGSIQGL